MHHGTTNPWSKSNRSNLRENQGDSPWLTSAMTRAFAVADTRAAAELDCAAAEIQTLLARTLRGGEPTPADLHIAAIISDVWLANLVAFCGHRASAADTRRRR